MADEQVKRPNVLRLVSAPQAEPRDTVQLELFGSGRTVFVLFTANLSEESFLDALIEARPECVVDTRTFPRFDFGRLTRKRVFEQFAQDHTTYKAWVTRSDPRAALLPMLTEENIPARPGSKLRRLLVLCDDRHQVSALIDTCRSSPEAAKAWSFRVLNSPSLLPRR